MFLNFEAIAGANLGIWAQTQVGEYEDSTKFNSTLKRAGLELSTLVENPRGCI